MKKVIQFCDVLGNVIQIKASIDSFRQLENKPYWIAESRKIFPQGTIWSPYLPFENQYFNTEQEVYEAIEKRLLEYTQKSKNVKKKSYF